MRRHRVKVVAGLVLGVALLALVVLLAGEWQRRSFERGWAKIVPGTSQTEVRRLLGSPKATYGPTQLSFDGGAAWVRAFDEEWAYGPVRLLEFPWFRCAPLDGLLNPERNDYVISFSEDGNVVNKDEPEAER